MSAPPWSASLRPWRFPALLLGATLIAATDPYWATFLTRAWCIAIGALGVHLLLGSAGLLSFGQALFLGVGGYAAAFAARSLGSSNLLLTLPLGAAAGGLGAFAIARLIFGQRPTVVATLALATMTLCYVAERLANEWDWTGGRGGMPGVPPLSFLGTELTEPWQMLLAAAIALFAAYGILIRLLSSKWGLRLTALRDDEMRLRFLGISVARDKQAIFAVAGAMSGLAGALLAGVEGFVGPSSLGPVFSTSLVLYVLLAGVRSPGATIVSVALVQWLSFVMAQWYEQLWPVILAVLMLVVVVVRSLLDDSATTKRWNWVRRLRTP
jgi:branched-chain amino acid transport system permease protein